MDIAKRDLVLKTLNAKIDDLQNFSKMNLKEIEKIHEENEFLGQVANDYKKHYDAIVQLKEQQKDQMEFLLKYLLESMEKAGLSDSELKKAVFEKEKIEDEILSLSNQINELLS